jgi:hypothetical protein
MKLIGDKNKFAIAYEAKSNSDESIFDLYIENKPVCVYIKNNEVCNFIWNIGDIVEWFELNLCHIIYEDKFPLPVFANTSVEFYEKSDNFDSEDDEEFAEWYEKRQDWYFRHSWYSGRAGGFLAEVYFRRVGNMIEISWNNSDLYENIRFKNPTGIYYVAYELFENIINSFITSYKQCLKSS